MDLTRRDAVAALAALGVGGGAAATLRYGRSRRTSDPALVDEERIRATLVAAAEVVYPRQSTASNRLSRPSWRDDWPTPTTRRRWTRPSRNSRSCPSRGTALDSSCCRLRTGTDSSANSGRTPPRKRRRARPPSEFGTTSSTAPARAVRVADGGKLVGLENPQGHAGGIDTYQRGPDS
ncbi:hypothetical protein ACFQMM_16265 [Saliphagus sp. GCM10025308]